MNTLKLCLSCSLGFFSLMFVNVVRGAYYGTPFLNDSLEALTLFTAVVFFVISMVIAEKRSIQSKQS